MLKKIAIGFGIVVLAVCIFVCCALFGNPLSKMLVTKSAEKYISENWQDENYIIDAVEYDFKTSDYYVIVKDPDSIDNHFTVYCGLSGKVFYDTYEDSVLKKWNTAQRINGEYREAVEKLFTDGKFPYVCDIAFGEIEFTYRDYPEYEELSDYAVSTDELTLDGEYDIYDIGKKSGCLTVYVDGDEVSVEKLSEILLKLKEVADEEKVGFCAIDCVLEYPIPENGEEYKYGRVEVMDFSYDDIYEKDLVKRVEKANENAKAYYGKLDSMKEEAVS